jgi:putative two-component system response regulator
LANTGDEERGLQPGAADYIIKPITPAVVLAKVHTQLEAKLARDWIKDQNATLETEVARRMTENDLTQRVSIQALAHLAETRDPDMVDAFLANFDDFVAIAERYIDTKLKTHPVVADEATQNRKLL